MKLIIKSVGDYCNIKCKGCFYFDKDQSNVTLMDQSTLEKIIDLSLENGNNHYISWHGGEPLLAGIDFYEYAISLQKKHKNSKWINSIQTNGILLNKKWVEFLKTNNFGIGISINGNREFHDAVRLNQNGKGTYDYAIRGLNLLHRENINPGIICTVTKSMETFGKKIFHDLVKLGATYISFNPMFNSNEDDLSISEKGFEKFISDIFDEWVSFKERKIKIREIYNILYSVNNIMPPSCSYGGNCSKWISINYDGNIYLSCERMIGNYDPINSMNKIKSFNEIYTSNSFLSFDNKIKILPEKCNNCNLKNYCHNGCTDHHVSSSLDKEIGGEYLYCGARKIIYNRIISHFSK